MREAERDELIEKLKYDTPFWARHCAKIVDKRRKLVPLIPFPWQIRLDAALERQRKAGLPMRAIIVKARKLGFSTWTQAKFTQRCTQIEYQHALTVAQDTKTAGQLFNMGHTIWAHLPGPDMLDGIAIRPELTGGSFSENGRKFMSFGDRMRMFREQQGGLQSIMEIDTAQEKAAGRGYTPNLLHGSEVAHWPGTEKLLSVLNAVPDEEETIIVLESTANGLNHFHTRWEKAVQGAEDPETGGMYAPIFAGWQEDPKNARPFASPESRQRFIDSIGTGDYGAAEPFLYETLKLSPEQLFWRRTTIKDKTDDDPEQFKQEYPATAEEAFLGSGNPVFSSILVSKALEAAVAAPEPVTGWLEPTEVIERPTRSGTVLVPVGASWVPLTRQERRDPLLVWEHPLNARTQAGLPDGERRPDGQYVMGVDVAEGLEHGDRSVIEVIEHRTGQQVMEWAGDLDTDELRWLALLVGLYYNTALIAVEVTGGYGLPIIAPLNRDYGYRRTFRRESLDTKRRRAIDKAGWDTNIATKPMMEDTLRDGLRQGVHGIRSKALAGELRTYVRHDNGKHGAELGKHDDRLMAYMIAKQVARMRRPRKGSLSVAGGAFDDVTGYFS